jgi:hypothetical protein
MVVRLGAGQRPIHHLVLAGPLHVNSDTLPKRVPSNHEGVERRGFD